MDVREKLVELLTKYFDIGDSYCYNLTRTKNAFACGTMGFDDFEEFDDETVADIADHLIANGVTVQEWISVKDRLPEDDLPKGSNVKQIKVLTALKSDKGVRTVRSQMRYRMTWYNLSPWAWKYSGSEITHWQYLPQPPKGE